MLAKLKPAGGKLSSKLSPLLDSKWSPWLAWLGIPFVVAIYIFSQIFGLILLIDPILRHLTLTASVNWLSNSIYAQFFYLLLVETFTVVAVLQLLKLFNVDKKTIGLRRPKRTDPLYTLIAAPIYYVFYIIAVVIISALVKGLNVSENQNVGFTSVHGAGELIVTFISLVVLPPIAEEILVRGFLYSSLKRVFPEIFSALGKLFRHIVPSALRRKSKEPKNSKLKKVLPQLSAALLTSAIFASAHLPEGASGLLWIAFIDTFILSMVLIYLREHTNGLWSGMLLHAIKNGVAFYVLYLAPLLMLHI